MLINFFVICFRNEEAKAARLAREIESNPSSQNRANLENGDEEERSVNSYYLTSYIKLFILYNFLNRSINYSLILSY